METKDLPTVGGITRSAELALRILTHGRTSFVEMALLDPSGWLELYKAPALRHEIAEQLGWPTSLNLRMFASMSLAEIVAVVLNMGMEDAFEFWHGEPECADQLHREGRFRLVAEFLGWSSPAHYQPETLADAINTATPFWSLQAWLELDRQTAACVISKGWFLEVSHHLSFMPDQGWITRGGVTKSIALLIVARDLEGMGVGFSLISGDDGYLHTLPLMICQRQPDYCESGDVLIPDYQLVLRVGRYSGGLAPLPQYFDLQGFRVAFIDEGLLHGPGQVIAFVQHVRMALRRSGLIGNENGSGSYSDLLRTTPAPLPENRPD